MSTIDYGIDLGTTNSAIAVHGDDGCRLLTGDDGDPLLPSAVHVTDSGEILVGRAARAAMVRDPANTALEFKRQMGSPSLREFPALGQTLSPEQLSAEVLRVLLARATAHTGETPRAAVITVPAMFQLPQCEATRRAATLAGIAHAPLLQEPIAAAIAHSGSGEVRNGSWLVYDLGGGTFDVSLVRCRDGRLQVLDHDGDNHLGGRDFDRLIAHAALKRIRVDGRLGELKRTDPGNSEIHARIKAEAERVRLALSDAPRARFALNEGDTTIAFDLDRDELEALLLPTVQRTAALCKKILTRNRMHAEQLSGLVLVGGPTRTPCVPRIVSAVLGIEVGHSADPMTIVASGAALFASTQRLPTELRRKRAAPFALQLEYEAMTTNPNPLVVGKVLAPSPVPAGLSIILARNGRELAAPVQANGTFSFELSLTPSASHTFLLGVRTASGATFATDPEAIKILHGFAISRPPLSQSIGVVLADNSVVWYLRKGVQLPARRTMTHATMLALERGESGEAVHVPLVQGEAERGNRNPTIGVIRILAQQITRDLPAGSTVEVTISVDESSQTVGRAYVPALDQWFDNVVRLDLETRSADEVMSSLAEQKDRLAKLAALADGLGDSPEHGDARIAEVEALLEDGDRDDIDVADQLVRTMTTAIDAAVVAGEQVSAQTKLAGDVARATEVIDQHGDADQKRIAKVLRDDVQSALARGDGDAARAKSEQLGQVEFDVLARQPRFWIDFFHHLRTRATELRIAAATPLIRRGEAAIVQRRIDELAEVCHALMALLPEEPQAPKDQQAARDQQAQFGPAVRSDIA